MLASYCHSYCVCDVHISVEVHFDVLQAVCAIFERSVKTLLHDFAPMVSQLSEMLGQMYSTIPQASALDLTRQVHTQLVQLHITCHIVSIHAFSYICSEIGSWGQTAA